MMIYAGFLILAFAAFYDIKTMEVPLCITIGGISLNMGYLGYEVFTHIITLDDFIISILCGSILFIISGIGMKWGNLGGADALLICMIGLILNIDGILSVLISYLLVLPYTVYLKQKNIEHEYPFVPYLCVGYLITMILIAIR